MRGIGVISMLALARILAPEDFGLIAIVSSFVFLFEIISEAGSQQYIIQKDKVSETDLNTVWTVNIILKTICWLIFCAIVPLIASFFDKPELTLPLYVCSIILIISGFNNPGMFLYQKEFNFKPHFNVSVAAKMFSFAVTIALAITYQSYWAMVFGILTTYTVNLIGSYIMHSYRPLFSLKGWREQWNFSKWMLSRGVLGYIRSEVDTMFTSKLFNMSTVGGYNMMKNLTMIPAQDIITPATQPLLSSFSKVKADSDSFLYQLNLSLVGVTVISVFMATFCFFNADILVNILLGDKWLEYSDIFKYMSAYIITFSIMSVFIHAVTSINKVRWLFIYDLLSMLLVLAVLLSFSFENITIFAMTRVLITVVMVAFITLLCSYYFKLSTIRYLFVCTPPLVFCVVSGFAAQYILSYYTVENPIYAFLLSPILYLSFFILQVLLSLPVLSKIYEIQYFINLVAEQINKKFR